MNFEIIGAEIGKAVDSKKGAKIGKVIGIIFQAALPVIISQTFDESEALKHRKQKTRIKRQRKQFGFTIK